PAWAEFALASSRLLAELRRSMAPRGSKGYAHSRERRRRLTARGLARQPAGARNPALSALGGHLERSQIRERISPSFVGDGPPSGPDEDGKPGDRRCSLQTERNRKR